MSDTEKAILALNTRRVVDLGRDAGWTDDHLDALFAHFDPALVRRFDRDDVYLHDNRMVTRTGVAGIKYDKSKWAAILASLEG